MKIRRLEIQGFKSFADRTVLKFGDGITGVVGPNGCGKSNIVDAIRWVMGEQSAKHLRGAGMQDVIFAGSDSRGPMGMAEVTISFANDGLFVPAEYQKFDEISVTRRLFRDGSSEYAINRVPSRLRDILDLFLGTGIGKNAYSIIEQGRIGLIVTAKPEDRRALIEDAAGVSRYKARRKQAERRIEATEQNLLRVTDMTDALRARLETLEAQADKARAYTQLKEELRGLELHAGVLRLLEIQSLERYHRGEANRLAVAISEREQQVAAEEQRTLQLEKIVEERRNALRGQEHQLLSTRQSKALTENNMAAFCREQTQLEARRTEAESELTSLRAEREQLRAEAFEAEQRAEALEADQRDADGLVSLQNELAQAEESLESARTRLESQREELFKLSARATEARAEAASVAQRRSEVDARLDKLHGARKASIERARTASQKLSHLESQLSERQQLRLALETRRTDHAEVLERMTQELAAFDQRVQEHQTELADRRAHLQSLQEIQRSYEGFDDAVRTLMRRKSEQDRLGASLHGLVADVVSAEPQYETAVEAVLGDRLQYVIVDSLNEGVESVQYLRSLGEGRSTFVPLDLREDHASWAPRRRWFRSSHPPWTEDGDMPLSELPRPASSSPGFQSDAGPAIPAPSSLRSSGDESFHAPILDHEAYPGTLLPATGPVQDVDPDQVAGVGEPRALSATQPPPPPHPEEDLPIPDSADSFVWVEAEDDHWPDLSHPSVVGKMVDLVRAQPGYEHVARVLLGDVVVVQDLDVARRIWSNNGHRKTLVTLAGEVLDPVGLLTGGAAQAKTTGVLGRKRTILELQEEVARLNQSHGETRARRDQLKAKVKGLETELADLSRERHQEELSLLNLEQEASLLRSEVDREAAEQRALLEDIETMEGRAAELQATQASLVSPDVFEEEHKSLDASVQVSAQSVQDLVDRHRTLQEAVTELRITVAANRERRVASRRSLERLRDRLTDGDVREEKLLESLDRIAKDLAGLEERLHEQRSESERLDELLRAQNEVLDEVREQLSREEQTLREETAVLRSRRSENDGLKEHAGELAMKLRELELGRTNLLEQFEERYHIDLQTLVIDYHSQTPQGFEDARRIKRLKRQIDQMGPINLTAVDECATVRDRFTYLEAQRSDLEEAVASLRNAIRRINKTSRERYLEAYRLVNDKFQQVFPRLFNGGRCALVMTDESDPLESGIEIMAQPPGKKLQSVNLLSGGEKALTAVSLIFGIFLIKPTPFCLLDEVDAPLDETNVGRYNEMLREISSISQFILITHNKRTMELPDRLYGVTMEEPGISKLVPVDVTEGTRMVSNG